jgi:aspartyl-tRNA(Asn)/glutamyl-tRNA(Gln) amidotransferase subunit B
VDLAITAGLALDCDIQPTSVFARKNYFYPDLPKGYQISQYDKPICLNGHLDILLNGTPKTIRITRIHMEEDAGKLLHQGADAISGSTSSWVDLNRACTPLIEIVSEPDISSPEEAKLYVETLAQILSHTGVCDGNLEEGSLRADINISLRRWNDPEYGTRTEIKNLNSFRSIERAILSEIDRQATLIRQGKPVLQETRHYDDTTQKTRALRSKADAHDYRYFPDPDLLPLHLDPARIDTLKRRLPELPKARRIRYHALGLSDQDCDTLFNDLAMMTYFETTCSIEPNLLAKTAANWITGDLNALLKNANESFDTASLTPENLVELLMLIQKGTLSGKMGKEILVKMHETREKAGKIVAESGAAQVTDTSTLVPIITQLLDQHPEIIEKVKSGRTNAADFLIGQVMKQTKGQAKPDLVRDLLQTELGKRL